MSLDEFIDRYHRAADAFSFRNALGTIPEEGGIEQPPLFFPAHTAIAAPIEQS